MSNLLKEMSIRKNLETPPFFKKVIKIGKIIGLVGAGLTAVALSVPTAGLTLPPAVLAITSSLATGGLLMVKVSQLTVKSTEALENALKDLGE